MLINLLLHISASILYTMSGENVNKQEFHIRDLLTRSVTFYPASAHVVRDISDIVLKVTDVLSSELLKSEAD